ncbi:SAYSvFN domain-containing protein 1 [Gastrophryne carolinensis]
MTSAIAREEDVAACGGFPQRGVQELMEQRLAEYRARKSHPANEKRVGVQRLPQPEERKTLTEIIKEKICSACGRGKPRRTPDGDSTLEQSRPQAAVTSEEAEAPPDASLWKVTLLLKFLLWLVLLGLFVELEFGLAYFLLSMFYWIYEGTRRPGRRKKGEKSAYSVFNPGCEAIQGTLTAEQFERELQYRPLAGT